MKKCVIFAVLILLCGNCLANVIKVVGVSPAGDVTIDAGISITKPKGCWPFMWVMRYDIFKTTADNTEAFVARIIITQSFATHSVGSITTRQDGSGVKPNVSEIAKGMICRETTPDTLLAEKKVYKSQKKAFKRQYKLMKLRAKSGVFETLEKTVQDPNQIKSINHKEQNGDWSESVGIEKK